MSSNLKKYGFLALKILAAAAFLAAGSAKLVGAEFMVTLYETLGVGQWFRYVTGAIEVIGAVLLFVPGRQGFGAGLLMVTMIGAMLSHVFILGVDTMPPSVVLFIITAIITYTHRDQLPIVGKSVSA
ncbi:MAG: DoxX family protein [Alphaproteobacteria bacterium]|nr:DoxX family protein [Alphaproteobacteria bacterium]